MARKPWMIILLALYVAAILGTSIPRAQKMKERSDHFVVWNAGKNFFQHKDLYSEANIRPYSLSPFAAFLLQPLHALSYRTTALILLLFSALVLLPLTVLLLYKILVNMGVSTWRSRMVLVFARWLYRLIAIPTDSFTVKLDGKIQHDKSHPAQRPDGFINNQGNII